MSSQVLDIILTHLHYRMVELKYTIPAKFSPLRFSFVYIIVKMEPISSVTPTANYHYVAQLGSFLLKTVILTHPCI